MPRRVFHRVRYVCCGCAVSVHRFGKWCHHNQKWLSENGFGDRYRGDGHGVRKGVTSLCANIVDGPPILAVLLRAMWAIGEVQETYITLESGSDLFLGRCAVGLWTDSPRFAVLPPHWINANHPAILAAIKLCFPQNVIDHPDICWRGLKMTLASLVFHAPWIRKHFHGNHAIFSNPLFSTGNLITELAELLFVDTSVQTQAMMAECLASGDVHPRDQRVAPQLEVRFGAEIDEADSTDDDDDDDTSGGAAGETAHGIDGGEPRASKRMRRSGGDSNSRSGNDGSSGGNDGSSGGNDGSSGGNDGSSGSNADSSSNDDDVVQRRGSQRDHSPADGVEFPVPRAGSRGLTLQSPHLKATGVPGHIRTMIEQRRTNVVLEGVVEEVRSTRGGVNELHKELAEQQYAHEDCVDELRKQLTQRADAHDDCIDELRKQLTQRIQGNTKVMDAMSVHLRKLVESCDDGRGAGAKSSTNMAPTAGRGGTVSAAVGLCSTPTSATTAPGVQQQIAALQLAMRSMETQRQRTSRRVQKELKEQRQVLDSFAESQRSLQRSLVESQHRMEESQHRMEELLRRMHDESQRRTEAEQQQQHQHSVGHGIRWHAGSGARAPPPPIGIRLFTRADGTSRRVPADFELPHGATAEEAWLLWWCPNPVRGICAARLLETPDVTSRTVTTLQEWRALFNYMLCRLRAVRPHSRVFLDVASMETRSVARAVWYEVVDTVLQLDGVKHTKNTPATINKRCRAHKDVYINAKARNCTMDAIRAKWSEQAREGDGDDDEEEEED